MKRLLFLLFSVVLFHTSFGWGFWAHKKINRMAVFTLPEEMLVFYKPNIAYLEDKAVNPDKRRYVIPEEAPRHFIDMERYSNDSLRVSWDIIQKKYPEDTLNANGILPWNLFKVWYELKKAFTEKNGPRILKYSTDLGHYCADAHVPLHTTENYNGQLTGQNGIHGLWESRIPEKFGKDYDFLTGKALYIDDVKVFTWNIIMKSHELLDSVLLIEKGISADYKEDSKYAYQKKGQKLIKTYSDDYVSAYNSRLSGMVEERLRASILDLGSLWFTAWIAAGQPDLKGLSATDAEPDEAVNDNAPEKVIKGHLE